jgi:hypothetical protein
MEHLCHKCGHSIEDGKAFCSQCGAPQIRVATAESPAVIADFSPAMVSGTDSSFGGGALPALPTRWSGTLRPCALAAAVAVGLMFLGMNPFVSALGAGFLAAAFSQRRTPGLPIGSAYGARLGAFSGLLLFAMSTLLEALVVALLHKGPEVQAQMMEKLQQVGTRYPGPQVEPFLEFVKSPGGFAFMVVFSLFFGLVAFLVMGAVGGAISAAFVGRRKQRP